jgi:hypothetical protein
MVSLVNWWVFKRGAILQHPLDGFNVEDLEMMAALGSGEVDAHVEGLRREVCESLMVPLEATEEEIVPARRERAKGGP